ncbi:histone h1-binding protein [Botrytis cinerea]
MAEPIEPPITLSTQASADLEAYNSAKVSLAEYCAKGTAEYAQKRYDDAVDHYAQAAELQAEINGEMSPENAEILFLYGRALFKVAQQQSDVLVVELESGAKKVDTITEEDESVKTEDEKKDEAGKTEAEEKADKVAEEEVAIIANGGAAKKEESSNTNSNKPLFTFTGDENFEDSDEEEEEAEEEDEEDDPSILLSTSWI